jgi:site-specific DNA recombinase
MPRGKKARPRAARGRPAEPRRSNAPVAADLKEWVFVPVPGAGRGRSDSSDTGTAAGEPEPRPAGAAKSWILVTGLTWCARCGYAYYGKTTHQMGAGHQMKDFRYYRCSGSDGYRFGGERICSNAAGQGEFLESAVWHEVCELPAAPREVGE